MSTAVLDTNVLASGFTHQGSIPNQLLQGWLAGSFDLAYSDHIFDELTHTFRKPYFLGRLGLTQIGQNLNALRRFARLTPITVDVRGVATHPEDDLVLATAVSAHADYLATGDRKLRALGEYEGVSILNPREFREQLG